MTIYLDHNATTPVLPEVVDAMLPYLREHFGNPSSGHEFGRRAKAAVDNARAQLASLINAEPDEIVFTATGTEANNLAIKGVMATSRRKGLITSVIDHPATLSTCRELSSSVKLTVLPVSASGRVDLEAARGAVSEETALITLMHSNNETGVLQPIAEVGALAQQHGALFHVDGAQSVGKVPVDVRALHADLLSIVGHKFYAPKGIGALFVRRGVALKPLAQGGGQERHLRPGTENVPHIVAIGAAAARAQRDLREEGERQSRLRDELYRLLREQIPGLALNGDGAERLPNTLNVRFPNARGSRVLELAPELAASTGAACHDGGESASSIITAMGVSAGEAIGSVRLSLGRSTTGEEVKVAAGALVRAWRSAHGER
ncbi:MAG: cysteine desulfurase family protein [Myxococcaceae bacterium]